MPGGVRPLGGHDPFRVILDAPTDGQVDDHRNTQRGEHFGGPDPGHHQQVRRLDRAGREHHAVGIDSDQAIGPGRVDSSHAAAADA